MIDEEYWGQFGATLSHQDLQKIFRRSENTVWRWLMNGSIPGHKVKGAWIVFAEVVQNRLEDPKHFEILPLKRLAEYPDQMTREETARFLDRPKETIYKWLAAGDIPGHQFAANYSWEISKRQLTQFLLEVSNQARDGSDPPPVD